MPTYKYYYFDLRCRGELPRLIFHYADAKYEDYRVEMDQWDEFKPKTPFGQLPVLQIDGVMISQSSAIARYLAKEFNLAGGNNVDAAKADMLVDTINDMWSALSDSYMCKFTKNPDKFEIAWGKFKSSQLTQFLDRYTKLLTENNSGWMVGNQLSWADLATAEFLSCLEECFDASCLQSHTELNTFKSKVLSDKRLAAYLASRPKTMF